MRRGDSERELEASSSSESETLEGVVGGSAPPPRRALTLFDAVNLVVGAIVGADVYIVAALGAQLLGPAALLVWALAGLMALALAMAFAQCAMARPRVGGSYAYVRAAFGPFLGFMVGWSLYLAQLVAGAVFVGALVRYVGVLLPGLSRTGEVLASVAFVVFTTATNYVGVRTAGTVNDLLTVGRVLPFVAFVLLGVPWGLSHGETAIEHVSTLVPLRWEALGTALALVFWAYAGFEVVTLPAREVRHPRRTLPLALGLGMLVVMALYILVNAVTIAVLPQPALAASTAPLVDAARVLFRDLALSESLGVALMGVGAVLSIGGVAEATTLGTSRLAHTLARDGYLPAGMARMHHRFRTPSRAIVFQGVVVLVLSLVFAVEDLVVASVAYLSLTYLATGLAAQRLATRYPWRRLRGPLGLIVPPAAVASSLLLATVSLASIGPETVV
ncbi:MAG TPA: APC family permease, partial [Chloroflexota bacterium]